MAGPSGRGGIVQTDLAPTEMPNSVAAPTDTYQAITKSQSPGAQFLEGLGKLSAPAATALTTLDQQAGDDAEAQANVKALSVPPEELRKEITSGNYFGMAHRRAQSALRIMDASNRANDINLTLSGMNAKGELVGPDVAGKIGLLVGEQAAGVAGDPLAEKAFANAVTPVVRKYTNDAYANNVANAQQNTQAKLTDYMRSRHDVIDANADAAGVKGNNPGNIEAGDWAQGRPGYVDKRGENGRFAFFDTPASGYRAANDLIENYARKGIVTPAAIIARWAPPSDGNDVASYVASVVKGTGLDPNAPLPKDMASRAAFLTAMTKVEHGKSPYSAGQVKEWLEGGNTAPDDLTTTHRRAVFETADFAKNALLLSPDQIEKSMATLLQHYSQAGNVAAVDAIGAFDRNGAPLRDRYASQFDTWRKQAEAVSDANRKKEAASRVDTLEAAAINGNMRPEDFNAEVDRQRLQDPVNMGEARAASLKQRFAANLAAKQKAAADALAKQQEASVEREYVEHGARALMDGNGFMVPETGRFTAADGVERTYARKDYMERMFTRSEALIDQQAQRENWTPESTALAKVKLYSTNGAVQPVFQRSFADLFEGSKGGIPPNPQSLSQRLGQLEFLRDNDPASYALLSGGNKQQELWLTAYRAARDFGAEPETAYARANQRVFKPENNERLSASDRQSKIEDVVKAWTSSGMLGGGMGVLAGPIARGKASEAVDLAIAAGVADKDIVSRAAESLQRNHLIVNGVPLHNSIPGVGDPHVAAEYLEDGAKYVKENNPTLKGQPFKIVLGDDPAKPGNYTLYRADTMERITRPGQPDSSISGGALRDYVMAWRERDRMEKKVNAESLDRIKTLTPEPLPVPTDAELAELGRTRRKALADVFTFGRRGWTAEPPTERDLRAGD